MRNESSPAISIRSAVSLNRRAISRFSTSLFSIAHNGLRLCAITLAMRGYGIRCQMRLHVNEDVRNPVKLALYVELNGVCNLVRIEHGEIGIHFQVQVDVITQAGFPRE